MFELTLYVQKMYSPDSVEGSGIKCRTGVCMGAISLTNDFCSFISQHHYIKRNAGLRSSHS